MALLLPSSTLSSGAAELPTRPRPRRRWRDKFRDAFRGLKLGVRGHSSFFVHFFFTALVVAAAIVLHCEPLEWCLLLGCIGMVLVTELFNSALETLFRGLDDASGVAGCLSSLANLAWARGERDRATELFTECLTLARQYFDTWQAAYALHALGHLAFRAGSLRRARSLLDEA